MHLRLRFGHTKKFAAFITPVFTLGVMQITSSLFFKKKAPPILLGSAFFRPEDSSTANRRR